MKNYQSQALIHSNANNQVYSAINTQDHHMYILKKIRKNPLTIERLQSELNIHQQLSHENVVHLKGSFSHLEKGVDYMVMVLEYCSGGSLDLVIPSEIDLVGRVGWLLDVAKGIQHLHSKKIIHRDIKPENVMLSRGRAKLGDLGIAKYLREPDLSEPNKLGTFWYNSPQIFEGQSYGCQTDVWSFGILCLQIILNQRINTLLQGQAPPARRQHFPTIQLLENIQQEKLRNLVKKMLSKFRTKRPSMNTIVQKLAKRYASLKKNCQIQQMMLEIPLQESNSQQIQPKPEWLNRIDPSKQKSKAIDKYKMKTTKNIDVIVKYDDCKQTLRITYESMEIVYQYKSLPKELKEHFANLSEFNQVLKASNTKISFSTSGVLTFPFKARLPYDPSRSRLSQSMSKSDKSSYSIHSAHDRNNILKKYEQQVQEEIPQVDEESSLGGKLSGKNSGSKRSQRSQFFVKGEKFRDFRENEDRVEGEQETIAEVEQEKHEEIKDESSASSRAPQSQQQQPQQQPIRLQPPLIIPQEQIVENTEVDQQHSHQIIQEDYDIPQDTAQRLYPHPPSNSYPSYHPQPQPVNPQMISQLQSEIAILQQVEGPERVLLPDHYMNLSNLYFKSKDPNKSEECLRKAIDHYFENHLYYSDKCARAHYYLGKIYLDQINTEDIPKPQEVKEEDAPDDFQSGDRYKEDSPIPEERPLIPTEEKALKEFQTAINILSVLTSYDFATWSKVYNVIGQLYLDANWLILAQDYFLNALRRIKDPSGKKQSRLAFKPTLNLGKVYSKWHQYNEASQYFEQALQIQPKNPNSFREYFIRIGLQACCRASKDFQRGLDHMERAMVLASTLQGGRQKFRRLLMKECKDQGFRWAGKLLELQGAPNRRHLVKGYQLLSQYFPQQTLALGTLASRIDMTPTK